MKRIVIIFLIALLPLHAAWSAGMCGMAGDNGVAPLSSVVFVDIQDRETQTPGFVGDPGCFPTCHFVCEPPAVAPVCSVDANILLPVERLTRASAAHLYASHIPDGPTRPKWTAAS